VAWTFPYFSAAYLLICPPAMHGCFHGGLCGHGLMKADGRICVKDYPRAPFAPGARIVSIRSGFAKPTRREIIPSVARPFARCELRQLALLFAAMPNAVLDCGGKRSATPLAPARNGFSFPPASPARKRRGGTGHWPVRPGYQPGRRAHERSTPGRPVVVRATRRQVAAANGQVGRSTQTNGRVAAELRQAEPRRDTRAPFFNRRHRAGGGSGRSPPGAGRGWAGAPAQSGRAVRGPARSARPRA